MVLAIITDLILDFELDKNKSLTSAFVNKVIKNLYYQAAELVGMETYDASNILIDNFKIWRIIVQDASNQLNYWNQIIGMHDDLKRKPNIVLSEESISDIRKTGFIFEQIDVIQRYAS